MNYFTLIEDIKRTSLQFAEEFYEGDVYEFLNSGNHKYPSIILTTQNVSTTDNINSISGTLFCVDRLTDDSSNRLEIQSNAFNKLQRIISALEENTINLQSNTFTPFTEKFADLCGGMFVEFSFQYVGESLCEDLEIKEIELTKNGVYDIIGYDRAIVNVRPVVTLEDITITDNGEYTCGEGFDGFGKVNIDVQPPKIKVKIIQFDNNSVDANGILDLGLIDTSNATTLQGLCFNISSMKEVKGTENLDVSKVTTLYQTFGQCVNLEKVDVSTWDTSNVTNFFQTFNNSVSLKEINVTDWDVSKATNLQQMFALSGVKTLDLTKWEVPLVTEFAIFVSGANIISLVGGRSYEEVLEKNISVLKGLNVKFEVSRAPKIDHASIRAVINGVIDLTGQTSKTIQLTTEQRNFLTEEDIAIATAKNWTIA